MKESTLYSIGHGNKSIESLIEELKYFNIEFLIDIRSKPYSKYNPQFNQNELKFSLLNNNIKYTYMGDILGGLPNDDSCYTNGYVDYNKLKDKDFFKQGLQRLIKANEKKLRVAIMCSESKPEECHRTKLIGEELRKFDINLKHIVSTKNSKNIIIKNQNDVMLLVAPNGTVNLFGETLSLSSRKKYKNEIL